MAEINNDANEHNEHPYLPHIYSPRVDCMYKISEISFEHRSFVLFTNNWWQHFPKSSFAYDVIYVDQYLSWI